MLPLLVRRLVLAAVDPLRIDIASGDSVNRPGYDGVLQTVEGAPLVPAGQSVWEMGTDQTPASKANGDYKVRTAKPGAVAPGETTFVFVTPRRWQGKADWAAEKRAENVWRDVQAIDAVDLEQWLDRHYAVAAWARRQIVGTPDSLRDLEEVWELWATRTTPALSPALFTAGRGEAADRVRGWLAGPPACLRVRADSADEAVGFVAAVVQSLDLQARDHVRARAVLVTTPDAWRAVAGGRVPHAIIAGSPGLGAEAPAVTRGHRVVVAYGNESAGVAVDVVLPPLRRNELEDALREMNVPDERRRELAAESRGRIAALVDLLGGGVAAPHWAAPAAAPQLVPFVLAGSWSQTPGDLDAVRRLARVTADEVAERTARWANETDPPLRLVGGMWEWISRRRGWPHLGRFVTQADLAAIRQVAADALGEVDPRLTLAPDQRWMATIHDRVPVYSAALRKGLAETLAILAAFPDVVRAGSNPVDLVNGVVRELFGTAPSPDRWYSLSPLLRPLAEAAPDVFLSMVKRDAVGDAGVRAVLFQAEGLFGGSRHTELLWALETLAWSPEHLTRVALALGGLTVHDPGGNTVNRPAASLRTIFLAWKPYTAATVPQRLAALDALARRYPDVAFHLLRDLIPTRMETATPTPRPRWRPWADGHHENPTYAEYWEYIAGIHERALRGAGEDQSRWAALMSPIRDVPDAQLEQFFTRLDALPLERFAEEPAGALRRAVRHLLHQKRTIDGIYQALTDAHVARLERVYDRLAPSDRVRRDAWLFDNQPELLSVRGNDWEAEQAAIHRERETAIGPFVEDGGRDLAAIAEQADSPWVVGYYAGQSALDDAAVVRHLGASLDAEAEGRRKFAGGLITGRLRRDGWPWVERVFTADEPRAWPARRKAEFAFSLPFASATWDWVEGWGEDVAAEYWRTTASWGCDVDQDAARAIRTYLARNRPLAAFRIGKMCLSGDKHVNAIPPELYLQVLQAVTAVATGEMEAAEKLSAGEVDGYFLGRFLGVVERTGVADEQELARLEWIWLHALDHTERGTATLDRALATDPSFFATVVGLIYRSRLPGKEDEPPPEPDERDRARATQAWHLLHDWRGVPGRIATGEMDAGTLRRWVDSVRELFRASGHVAIGDQQIGEVLARVPAGADGVWPPECVRQILEDLQSEDIETGVYLGVVNGRGITCRDPSDGGKQERTLAERYERWAEAAIASPRTTRILRGLADNYRRDARREDDQRDLNEYYN